jgi:hypothetical protein
MEKTISPYHLIVIGEEEEKVNLQNQESWHGETLTLNISGARSFHEPG